jgi:hypothetical protein
MSRFRVTKARRPLRWVGCSSSAPPMRGFAKIFRDLSFTEVRIVGKGATREATLLWRRSRGSTAAV